MAVYRETDGDIVREYTLEGSKTIFRKQCDFALLEVVPTKAFGLSLFLDNELQFSEFDEYIYHEMLIHPCLSLSNEQRSVCIIGGGDGCAAREVLRWSSVEAVDLIDWDSTVTNLFKHTFSYLNSGSLDDPRILLENKNIQSCIHDERSYDCIVVDLLDPDFSKENQEHLWYDVLFLVKHWIKPGGSIVINLGGILPGDTANVEIFSAFLQDRLGLPYRLYKVFVPSFAREWCFALIGSTDPELRNNLPSNLRYLSDDLWKAATTWSRAYTGNLNPVHNS